MKTSSCLKAVSENDVSFPTWSTSGDVDSLLAPIRYVMLSKHFCQQCCVSEQERVCVCVCVCGRERDRVCLLRFIEHVMCHHPFPVSKYSG